MGADRRGRPPSLVELFDGVVGGRDAPSFDLRDVLAGLVGQIMVLTPFERVVVVAGSERDPVAVGRGVPEHEVEAFARAFARWRVDDLGPHPSRTEESPVVALASMRSRVLLPAPSPQDGFSAVVVVDAEPEHPALSRISELLRTATPTMVAAAEIHALASRLADTESRKRHTRSALDALPDPVLVTDSEARILFANRRAEELFVDDPAGDSGRRRAVEANRLVLGAARASIVAEGPNETPMALVDPEDGADLLFEVFAMSTHDPSAPAHVFVLRDVTHLEAATREMEAQFSRAVAGEIQARVERDWLDAIVQNAAVPIFVMDANTRLQLVNREAARLLEPRPGTAPTSPSIRDVEANHAKLAGFIGELLTHARARREARLVLVDPDGAREFPALAVSTKVLNERGEPAAVVTVLHDLTQELENGNRSPTTVEVTKRNTQLEEQQSALERAARVKNQFLATMSHELRTPINAVLGYNSLLRDGLFGTLTERQQDALARMRSAAEHLLSLINDILDLSRVEAGKLGLSPVVIDWPTFLETLCEPVRPLAATKTLALFVSIEKQLPAICADETRLRQVLLNLLTNAVKFTDHGSVELRVGSNPGSARVQIDVTDTGMGIAETHLETIFDEFTQVDQSSTREHGGAGLGLAISRRLIRFMGGSLTVESTPGRGSTFRVELPALPSAEPELGLGWLGASRTATT